MGSRIDRSEWRRCGRAGRGPRAQKSDLGRPGLWMSGNRPTTTALVWHLGFLHGWAQWGAMSGPPSWLPFPAVARRRIQNVVLAVAAAVLFGILLRHSVLGLVGAIGGLAALAVFLDWGIRRSGVTLGDGEIIIQGRLLRTKVAKTEVASVEGGGPLWGRSLRTAAPVGVPVSPTERVDLVLKSGIRVPVLRLGVSSKASGSGQTDQDFQLFVAAIQRWFTAQRP